MGKKIHQRPRMGPKLKKIEDVINIGDVIYIERYKNGDYVLAQIPEAAAALVSFKSTKWCNQRFNWRF